MKLLLILIFILGTINSFCEELSDTAFSLATEIASDNILNQETTIQLHTPAGEVSISIMSVIEADRVKPLSSSFKPPTFSSAPVKVGSGRGSAINSFMAIADDASAVFSNPSGLVELEKPEISLGYRYSNIKNKHFSTSSNYEVNTNEIQSDSFNYFSIAYPRSSSLLALSLNYKEVYDFNNSFSSIIHEELIKNYNNTTYSDEKYYHSYFSSYTNTVTPSFITDYNVDTEFAVNSRSDLKQVIATEVATDLEFKQKGRIAALGSSIAMLVNPDLSFGATINYFHESNLYPIGSEIKAVYSAITKGNTLINTEDLISGEYTITTTFYNNNVIIGSPFTNAPASFDPVIDYNTNTLVDSYVIEGLYYEKNEYDNLDGVNAEFGSMWVVNRMFTLGFTLEMPWKTTARQTKTIIEENSLYNENKTTKIDSSSKTNVIIKDVTFTFPLSWNIGGSVQWKPNFYSSFEIRQNFWSDFAFQAEGEEKINPLNGLSHKDNPLGDTWTIRLGSEYIWITDRFKLPIRGGLTLEQRPAIGSPDDYIGGSIGSGMSFKIGDKSVIFDFSYNYLKADDIQSIIPSNSDLKTDTEQHQVYASLLVHF